jgi:hypothetical protein
MRVHNLITLMVAAFGALSTPAVDRVLDPGWSPVVVRVIEHETGRPIANALIETTCNGSRYQAERPVTDPNGKATVPIYRTWVMLKVTHPGFTNGIVTLVGTNKVSAFCKNPVVKLGRVPR